MALRTNTLKAHANLWDYINSFMVDELEEARAWAEKESESFNYDESRKGIAGFILDTFTEEYLHEYNRNLLRTGKTSRYELFKSWAQGLALGGLFCYYYNREARKDVAMILEETEAEAEKFTEEQAEELLTRMIYNTVTKEANKA